MPFAVVVGVTAIAVILFSLQLETSFAGQNWPRFPPPPLFFASATSRFKRELLGENVPLSPSPTLGHLGPRVREGESDPLPGGVGGDNVGCYQSMRSVFGGGPLDGEREKERQKFLDVLTYFYLSFLSFPRAKRGVSR